MKLLLVSGIAAMLTGCAIYPDAPPAVSYPQYGHVYGSYYDGPYYPYGPYYYDPYPYYRHDHYRRPERASRDRDDDRNNNRPREERARLNDQRDSEWSGRRMSPSRDERSGPARSLRDR